MDSGNNTSDASAIFPWEHSPHHEGGEVYGYDKDRYWGSFPQDLAPEDCELPRWALGPFTRHPENPVLAPTPGAWDRGRFGGGVHNGATLVIDGQFHYIYRGEQELEPGVLPGMDEGYMCDIGLATSDDGIHFVKDNVHSPFFRHGEDAKFSFEDVCCVRYHDTYYLFCNRWHWPDCANPGTNGAFLATSRDLRHWTKHGLCFPKATRMHRNPALLQTPENEAVQVKGKFVMYLNEGIIAYSEDLLHWESQDIRHPWPGGENCFALVDWSPDYQDQILVFTGGNHCGHFYAVGETLIDRERPDTALEWLPRPILHAEPQYPWEAGKSACPPHNLVSPLIDCIFFNGLTRYDDRWWLYYGGSEVYTCLATAPVAG